MKKLAHKLDQQARTCATQPQNPAYIQVICIRSQRFFSTNGGLHPDWWGRRNGSCHRQYHPSWESPRQCWYAAARHPTILAALVPDIHISRCRNSSAMNLHQRQNYRLPSDNSWPPRGPPQGHQWRTLQCLPGLDAPKSWYPPVWRNKWGW